MKPTRSVDRTVHSDVDPIEAERRRLQHQERIRQLYLSSKRCGPLPEDMRSVCAHCNERLSCFGMLATEEGDKGVRFSERLVKFCSLCFYYETNWGKNRQKALNEYLSELEAESGYTFKRHFETGKLTDQYEVEALLTGLWNECKRYKGADAVTLVTS